MYKSIINQEFLEISLNYLTKIILYSILIPQGNIFLRIEGSNFNLLSPSRCKKQVADAVMSVMRLRIRIRF